MFDDCFAVTRAYRGDAAVEAIECEWTSIQIEIQVTVRRGDDFGDAGQRAKYAGQFLRDGLWRLAQGACELKRDSNGQITERAIWGHFDGERRNVRDAKLCADGVGHTVVNLLLNGEDHEWVSGRRGASVLGLRPVGIDGAVRGHDAHTPLGNCATRIGRRPITARGVAADKNDCGIHRPVTLILSLYA